MALLARPASAALVNAALSGPPTALEGQVFTMLLQVQNGSGFDTVTGVQATLQATGGFVPVLVSGPLPASAGVGPGGSAHFTWTYSGSGCGTATFQAEVSGSLNGTPVGATSNTHQVARLCTPTPTPTPSPVHSPTPWMVTATPVPREGWAGIPGNIFKPGPGRTLQFQAVLPEQARLSVDIYDRLGRRVHTLHGEGGPGPLSLEWDGRVEGGPLAATGIYAAHFKARGFSRTVKFAVVK